MIKKFIKKILISLLLFLMGAVAIIALLIYQNKKNNGYIDDVKTKIENAVFATKNTEEVEKEEKKEDKTENTAPVSATEQGGQTLIPGFQQDLQKMSQGFDNQKSYDKLVQKLLPSVVHIKVVSLQEVDKQIRYGLLTAYEGEIFPPKKIKALASGSGFFISEDGYIVTNHHVIDDAQDIDVETHNGKKYKATLVGSDESADLAVLKIKPNNIQQLLD